MTKMVHKSTKEVVLVIGYYINSKGTLLAECLCDARLHPYEKKQTHSGSVFLTFPAEQLELLDAVDWDSINNDAYPEGHFEKLRQSKINERRQSLESSAIAKYKKEYADCIKNGVPEEEAVRIAEEAKAKFIEEKMRIPARGDTKAMRMHKW